ncbi:hypothetical protein BAE44_0020866 [Dichanthelium oligosanthes]|uniref:Glutaredoxin domain-containing protein n=1 Tax=Dichanthelium oligosanthes TaxID=888268 RepID=A0A1E5UZC0_9POAL|nr:hypothetical protein BAE44_0020866 [Dichanthelium oligosanthes]
MKLASTRAVVVFTLSSCSMCEVVTQLMAVPAVFVGGTNKIDHVAGKLVPLLRNIQRC